MGPDADGLQYYNRWANHEQSAKLSMELYAKTEKKMEEMQITSELTWIQVQFMKKAVDIVHKCRMTLKWTYAMAYYLAPGNHKELFEDNQRYVCTPSQAAGWAINVSCT